MKIKFNEDVNVKHVDGGIRFTDGSFLEDYHYQD